jgi:hypothetical protein
MNRAEWVAEVGNQLRSGAPLGVSWTFVVCYVDSAGRLCWRSESSHPQAMTQMLESFISALAEQARFNSEAEMPENNL